MAKLTLSPVGNFNTAGLGTINANWDKIEAAVENTLSRDGSVPNHMDADLDMNGNDILNVGSISTGELTVGGEGVSVSRLFDAEKNAVLSASVAVSAQQGAEAARDLAARYISNAVSQGNVPIYDTVVDMSSLEVPAGINTIRVNGDTVAGDGLGNVYVDVAGEHAWRNTFTSGGDTARTWYEVGDILRPTTVRVPEDFATLNDLFTYLDRRAIRAKLSVQLAEGIIEHSEVVRVTHPDASNIEIGGVRVPVTIASVGAASGSAGAYDVPLTLDDASDVAVDDYIYIRAKTTSSDEGSNIEGSWRVLEVDGDDVTVRVTSFSPSFPAISDTDFDAFCLKTVLAWDSSVTSGISIQGTDLGCLKNCVVDGLYDVADGTSDDNQGYGILCHGTDYERLGEQTGRQLTFGGLFAEYVAAVRWKSNGWLAGGGGAIIATTCHACSNGWRGFQSGGGESEIFAKSSVASGNWETNYEAEAGGHLNIANSVSCGAKTSGLGVLYGGNVVATNARFARNVNHGADLRYSSEANLTGSHFRDNGLLGIYNLLSFAQIDNIQTSGNGDGSTGSQEGIFYAGTDPTSSLAETTKFRTYSGRGGQWIFGGVVGAIGNGLHFNSTTSPYGGVALLSTSGGDLVVGRRTADQASPTQYFQFGASDARPVTDNGYSLGRQANAFANAFAYRFAIKSGAAPAATAGHAVLFFDEDSGEIRVRLPNGDVKVVAYAS